MCTPSPFCLEGGGLRPDGTSAFRGGCWERGGDFFRGGGGGDCNFHVKNKSKSEIFNDKKSLQAKIFFSVVTKNSNWDILTKNLVTFKIKLKIVLSMKNFNIFGVHGKT